MYILLFIAFFYHLGVGIYLSSISFFSELAYIYLPR